MMLLVLTPSFVLMPALHRKGIKENKTLYVLTQSRCSFQRSIQFAWKITGMMFAVYDWQIHDLHAVHELMHQMKKMDMKVSYRF
jgi:hypothetical protein